MPNFASRLSFDEKLQIQFRDELRRALDANHCDLLLTPPLFLDLTLADRLASELGIPVAECLATSEPVPGQRMHRAMEAALARAEIPKHVVPQIEVRRSVGEILTLEIGEGRTLKGEKFYLATGKYIGGGVKLGYRDVSETLFNLPLFWHRTSEPVAFRSQLPIHPDPREAQPWARLGVWLNEKWQPQDQNRKSVYVNVVACGSIVGGVDYARENLGLGYMAYSGRRCVDVAP